MKKKLYFAPQMQEFHISSEGVLCASTGGAGELEDNSWPLQTVDEIDFDN